jgi:hypothetical protein
MFFPENYWVRQVSLIEQEIKQDKEAIRSASLLIESKRRTVNLDIERHLLEDKKLTRRDAAKKVRDDLLELYDLVGMYRDILKDNQRRLESARSQIPKQRIRNSTGGKP